MRFVLPTNRPNATVLAVVSVAVCLAGCAQPPEPVWTALPQVHWRHISTEPVEKMTNGYTFLKPTGSEGRFPAAVAVSRLAIEPDDTIGGKPHPYLPPKPKNEFLQWNNAFDDLMAISEVFPIARRDLGGGQATPQQIVAAFRALHAQIGLLYAFNRQNPTESEMIGIIYETESGTPLAAIHAHAASIVPPADEEDEAFNLWEYDSQALVRSKFRRLVYQCLYEMILNDQLQTVDVPEGWRPAEPVRPVLWPPRPF